MEKIHENVHFYVNFKHESTRTLMFPCKFFSAYFYPPLHHNSKVSIIANVLSVICRSLVLE